MHTRLMPRRAALSSCHCCCHSKVLRLHSKELRQLQQQQGLRKLRARGSKPRCQQLRKQKLRAQLLVQVHRKAPPHPLPLLLILLRQLQKLHCAGS